jgi:hypothetical protein
VPVSPYFGTDIWRGRGLDGLLFNTRRLIYQPRVTILILGGSRRGRKGVDVNANLAGRG